MRDSTCFFVCTGACYALELLAVYAMFNLVPHSVRPIMLWAAIFAALATLGFAGQALKAWDNGD